MHAWTNTPDIGATLLVQHTRLHSVKLAVSESQTWNFCKLLANDSVSVTSVFGVAEPSAAPLVFSVPSNKPNGSVICLFVYWNSSYCCCSWRWWWLAICHAYLQLSSVWDVSPLRLSDEETRVWSLQLLALLFLFHSYIFISEALQGLTQLCIDHQQQWNFTFVSVTSLLWDPADWICAVGSPTRTTWWNQF